MTQEHMRLCIVTTAATYYELRDTLPWPMQYIRAQQSNCYTTLHAWTPTKGKRKAYPSFLEKTQI